MRYVRKVFVETEVGSFSNDLFLRKILVRYVRGMGCLENNGLFPLSVTSWLHALFFISNARFWLRLTVAYYLKETSLTCCFVVAYYFLMLSSILQQKV